MLRDGRWRALLVIPLIAAAVALFIYHGPDWHLVHDAFTVVLWRWVIAAIGLNLLSVLARALSWDTTIKQSLDPPWPRFPLVFSAFSVGLFANAVLPGRVGELARVAVLRRRLPGRRGVTATLIGSVFAHRIFDVFPATALVIWVLLTAKIPGWALTSIAVVLVIGLLLFVAALLLARRAHRDALEGLGPARQLLARARLGLAVMRSPVAAATAASFQTRRVGLPAVRRLGDDVRVPHPHGAVHGGARARVDQRRDARSPCGPATSASCRSRSRSRS